MDVKLAEYVDAVGSIEVPAPEPEISVLLEATGPLRLKLMPEVGGSDLRGCASHDKGVSTVAAEKPQDS
jgi:hypothetical protein